MAQVSPRVVVSLNILLHVFILYVFLLVFFMVYVSKQETKAFQHEFENVVQDHLTTALEAANTQSQGQVKTFLQQSEPVLNVLGNMYQQPSPEQQTYNKWLFRMGLGVAFCLLLSFVLVVVVLRFSCRQQFPLGHMLKENAIIFVVIGCAEFLFFTRIAAKFIPVPPSLLVTSLFQRLKQNL